MRSKLRKVKPATWVRLHCPRVKCGKRLGDVSFSDDGELIDLDLSLEAGKMDPKAPLHWTKEQWDEHFRKKELARKLLDASLAESWPTVGRAADPAAKNKALGVPGPRTQYEGISQVGSPGGGARIRAEESAEGLDIVLEMLEPEPWLLQCSCGFKRTVNYERLAEMVRDTLARGEHHLTLP